MGNNSGKKDVDPCQKNLDELFFTISNKKPSIHRNELKSHQNELSCQTFKKFFFDMCKGGVDVKVEVLSKLLGGEENGIISKIKLMNFVKSILNSILIIQKYKAVKRYESWSSRMGQSEPGSSVNEYANYFLDKIHKSEENQYSKNDLYSLLNYFDYFLYMVLSNLYNSEDRHFYSNLLPKYKSSQVDVGKKLSDFSVLNLLHVIFLNLELPVDYQSEWRPLFSSKVDGESFSRLLGQITNQGPTIIVIKDKEGHIFGGFAPFSWVLGPNFFGDSRSYLFTLYPKMNMFPSTNFNSNYQYVNINQQTMPNGLGMGGKLEYFGLWIDSEFGKGYCSESCTTYRDYKMMSGSKNFEISHCEVWGVGPPPLSPSELGERSVLDTNLDAKAILEMAGKTTYSEGLREDAET
ncbi:conserved hypothetical protein [Pediculus humanus corporis]|uniref:MTOR-associated protein MEAK7 n=1 Tax=Pediculus humanus subsp. corporis TaxID=121224 RepID=E0VRJ8_PEDHC|nr:uncharacterized protein Phum_PHUM399500 [Pediculus humanus corporis]EEB16004.1 conserved hypothetical protein [Pediculus humanus corporis]